MVLNPNFQQNLSINPIDRQTQHLNNIGLQPIQVEFIERQAHRLFARKAAGIEKFHAQERPPTMPETTSGDVAISFKNIGISCVHPSKQILSNVSGYVVRGGITAILGPSASGKSLLMQALSGRIHNLKVTGELYIEGDRVDHCDISNSISLVPQEDILIGDLTARETLYNSAAMKRNKSKALVNDDVERLLAVLGLTEVADGKIGTPFIRGLSGGQKKRVEIGTELIAAPSLLFLDEPTSGLDASIAYDVLKSIKDIAKASRGELSIMLSIHQPNLRLLELVDHIMIIGGGAMSFFGTVSESIEHLSSIGFPPPDTCSPTDYFLQVSDRNFTGYNEINFAGSFASSYLYLKLISVIEDVKLGGSRPLRDGTALSSVTVDGTVGTADDSNPDHVRYVDASTGRSSFWRQYSTLVMRDVAMAARDPALYYIQFALVLLFGFLVGAAFLRTKYNIDKSLANVSGGLLWLVFMMAYIQIFKVYHLSKASARFLHEKANNTYTVPAAFLAELTTTSIGLLTFIPGTAVTYFMMGFENESYPFMMFVYWMTALTAESMVNFISRAWADTTTAIIMSQATMVILTAFGGGIFIPWDKTPHYWVWLQELSIFTQASRAAIMHMNNNIEYKCATPGPDFLCRAFGKIIDCDAAASINGFCQVKGRTVMYATQGTSTTDSPWIAFGYLVLIFAVARLGVLILMYYPADQVIAVMRRVLSTGVQEQLNEVQLKNRNFEDQLASMVAQLYRENNPDSQVVMKRTDSIGISNYENFGECLFADEYNPQKGGEIMHGAHEQLRCLVWSGLTLKLKKDDKVLIDNVSGAAYTGRVLALMGPSGAGKTTLLNALGNRAPYGKISGDITYGREPFSTSDLYFVPQFDEVNNNLTVFEQIELVGLLKCRDKMDMYIRLQIVLRSLGLYEKSKSSCRDLTGGELKKVSVGMGMISNPKVLFLDEPTTGLDSTAAYSIVHHLVDLAKQLKIAVIMTIHQPAEMVFDMLQDLYIMETGRLAYYGPLACCSKYFKGHGYVCPPKAAMADFFLDMVSEPPKGLHQTSWQSLYLNSKFHENICREQATLDAASPVMTPSSPPPSGITRFHEIIKFFVKYYSRDYGFYYQRILCLCIIAIFSGTLFLQLQPKTANFGEYSGAIFFNMWTVLFSAVAATGLLARDRRQAVEQIKNAVISPSLYCLGQLVVSIPFNFVAALTFQSIFHWLTNINPNRESFIYSVLLTCGHLLLMEAFMLLVVEVLKNAMLCVTFAMIVMGWLFLFAGFFIKVSDMPAWIRWISFITPTKYSFDGYLFQIFHSQSFSVSGSSPEAFMSGDTVLETLFAQTGVKPWAMFGTLLAWVALIRIAHYGALLFQVRQFRAKRFSKE